MLYYRECGVAAGCRDAERLELEIAGGLAAGAALIQGNVPKPTLFTAPRRAAEPLSEETAAVAETAKPG